MVQEFLYRTAIQVSVGLRPAYPCPSLSQGESGRMCSEKAQCPAFTQWEVSDCSFWSSWHSQGAPSQGRMDGVTQTLLLASSGARQCLETKAALSLMIDLLIFPSIPDKSRWSFLDGVWQIPCSGARVCWRSLSRAVPLPGALCPHTGPVCFQLG